MQLNVDQLSYRKHLDTNDSSMAQKKSDAEIRKA